jgi:hypothetical protein
VILTAVLSDGPYAIETACSSAVIFNSVAQRCDPAPAASILIPDALRLRHEPETYCARYEIQLPG